VILLITCVIDLMITLVNETVNSARWAPSWNWGPTNLNGPLKATAGDIPVFALRGRWRQRASGWRALRALIYPPTRSARLTASKRRSRSIISLITSLYET
jgi:hypothetical protein